MNAARGHAVAMAWLGAPPNLRSQPSLALAILEDLLTLLKPYGGRTIYTSEPRSYRAGSKGRALLAAALREQRLDSLELGGGPGGPAVVSASAVMRLSSAADQNIATAVEVGMALPPDHQQHVAVCAELRGFVTRWFVPLGATAAFVSDSVADSPMYTAHERAENRGVLLGWSALRRYARGVSWGNGLGPDLCAQLGGQVRVLREAPVPIVRPLGGGVWLQASEAPPAAPEVLARLADYLSPLLNWTRADVVAATVVAPPAPPEAAPESASIYEPQSGPRAAIRAAAGARDGTARQRRRRVPMRVRGDIEADTALNVYLNAPPTPGQRQTVETAVRVWYQEGFDGAFLVAEADEGGFHHLIGPSVEDNVMRWHVDLGSADERRALSALRERLASLHGVEVLRLVVGTERAS